MVKMTNLEAHYTANSVPHIVYTLLGSDNDRRKPFHRFLCVTFYGTGIKNIDGLHEWRVHITHLLHIITFIRFVVKLV